MENIAHFKDSVCNLDEANQDTSKKAEDFVPELWIWDPDSITRRTKMKSSVSSLEGWRLLIEGRLSLRSKKMLYGALLIKNVKSFF
jgi:hypothetical protein